LGHMFYRKILLSVFRESLAESIMTSATANTFAIVFASVAAAFAGAQIAKLVIQLLGASTRNMAVADTGAWIGTAVGAAAGMTAALVLGLSSGPAGWIALAVAAQVVVIYQLFNHQLYSREVFTYNPGLWQPQKGGENCEKCNDLEYGCSEYQCHTFGTGCKLLNPDSEEQRCYWANEDDISPPIISPMENSLLSSDYSYVETEQGAKVLYKGGCLPPFKGVTFGITTSDAALCKYDTDKKTKMEDMVYSTNFGLVAYMKNHRVAMSNANFPSQFELKNLGLEFDNSDEQNIWFMCESING